MEDKQITAKKFRREVLPGGKHHGRREPDE